MFVEVIKGQYHIGRQYPKPSSSQLAGLTPCAKRITPYLTSFYNSRNLNFYCYHASTPSLWEGRLIFCLIYTPFPLGGVGGRLLSLISTLLIFPLIVFGSSSTNSITRGYLYGAVSCLTWFCNSSISSGPSLPR